ncbi:MAG: D-alanine--D-alanine ligase [Desulfosudaceae bacterium]
MSKLTVALIAGGTSPEREISLAGGEQVFQALDKNRYDINRYDPAADLNRLIADAPALDTALVILHGVGGEDGSVQGTLDLLGIPYQCSGVLGSALAANKLAAKQIYAQAGLPTAPYAVITRNHPAGPEDLTTNIERLGLPLVVKPVSGGSSLGMSIVHAPDQLAAAVDKALGTDDCLLLEAFVAGRELTGGVIGNHTLQALPVVEIIPGETYDYFDYEAKYTPGATREICPAEIDADLTARVQAYACRAHQALFCKGCSRTDMIAAADGLYLLETNTIPGMVPTSLLPLAARAAGISFSALLDRLIQLSLEGY